MRIEIVGSNSEMPVSARVNVTGVNGRRKRTVVMTYVIYMLSQTISFICKYVLHYFLPLHLKNLSYDDYQF